jgi:CRISPR-associated protein (TIGR03986 family)
MIKAPFNFVPLNEKVFFPNWADKISHDMPFIDGESGEIDIKITAHSPIFVRNHSEDGNSEEFCNYKGQYFIPGSSVKGMIRSIVEIIGFAKLSDNLFTDNTYAVRDLSKADNFYMSEMNQHKNTTYCGWLKKSENGYIIEDCGIPGRIQHKQIDYALNIEFSKNFKSDNFNPRDKSKKTAKYKYSLIGNRIPTIKVGEKYHSQKNTKYDLREFYKFDKNGKKIASLILTGQPTARQDSGKMGDGKGFEFLFFESKGELKVDKKVFENFLFAYFDGRKTEPKESPDWTFWKEKLENGEKVPVFFQKENNKVKHFGLSYLYKLPYNYSVKDGIPVEHFSEKIDLAEAIFGYINKNKNSALKGRVQFSHFKATQNIDFCEIKEEILGTPRASYYPIYVKQNGNNNQVTNYKTFMNKDFQIKGRKRYPIHSNGITQTEDTGNENVMTNFRPMRAGAVFEGKLRFHNLKKAEIGAILSALTFHNTPNTFHSIGMAKPLGYGKIKVEVNGIEIEEYLKEFEATISEKIENWRESEQLKELISMATEQNNSGNSQLNYMELKEFAGAKSSRNRYYLEYYTKLNNINSISPKSTLSKEDIEERNKKIEEERKCNIKFESLKNSKKIEEIEQFILDYPNSNKIKEAKEMIKEIKESENRKIEEKYQNILNNPNEKIKKSALDKFIKENPEFIKIEEAKKILEELKQSIDKKIDVFEEIKKATNGKRVGQVITKEVIETQKDKLIEVIKECYTKLKGKNKKNFYKDAKIGKIDKEFLFFMQKR